MSNSPIVKPISDKQADKLAKEIFYKTKASVGQVPEWMRVMANCSDTLKGFTALFHSLMDNAPTDSLLKWKVAYVVSEINKCEYCSSVTKIKLQSFGEDEKSLAKIEQISTAEEKVAIEWAKAVTEHAYKIDEDLVKRMKRHFSDAQIVEITSVIGLFNYINRFNDALGVLPEVKLN